MPGPVNAGGANGPLAAGGFFTPAAGGVKTASYTAVPGDLVPVDTTGGPVTITLPTQPQDQAVICVRLVRQGGSNAVTVNAGGADQLHAPSSGVTAYTLASLYQGVFFQYWAQGGCWHVFDLPGNAAGASATGAAAPKVAALTDGATIATNAALGNDFRVTLAGNRAMAAPTNPANGQQIVYQVTQDATGSRTLTWNAAFGFGAAGAPTLSTGAGKTDLVAFVYNATAAKWLYLWSALGN